MFSEDQTLLLKKLDHMIHVSEKSGVPQFHGFLSEDDLDFAASYLSNKKVDFRTYGGFSHSERQYICVYSQSEPEGSAYPISVLKVELSKNSKPQGHRNYLGSILSLGLDRKVVGDILIDGNIAHIAVNEDFSDFLLFELKKISNENCTVTLCTEPEKIEREFLFEDITLSVASNRLDAVLSELVNLSRDSAKDMIGKGLVFVNGVQVLNPTKEIRPDSKISVRKFGKFVFVAQDGTTKSGRLRLKFKKYM